MLTLAWMMEAMQIGALAALGASFLVDAYVRRDKVMAWLSAACFFSALRFGVTALESMGQLDAQLAYRIQSSIASISFCTMVFTLYHLLSELVPKWLIRASLLAILPNLLRNLLLSEAHVLNILLRALTMIGYALISLKLIHLVWHGKKTGNLIASRIYLGILFALGLVILEASALGLFNLRWRLSGIANIILCTAMAASRQLAVTERLARLLKESWAITSAWQELAPGPAFQVGNTSIFMENTFGPDWESQLGDRMRSLDGTIYQVHSVINQEEGVHVGWVEAIEETQPGLGGFLSGWTVALGFDDSDTRTLISNWLITWGAEVQVWGTIPPREGPFPSLLIWGREPSILSVWREYELVRRRPRWIQVGGPEIEGPHVYLSENIREVDLKAALESLMRVG